MSQSLSKLYVHIIFHIKDKGAYIRQDDENELYAYIGAIIKELNSTPLIVNGVQDHLHVLCILSKNVSLAQLVEDIKRNSSRWIKGKGVHYANFHWQGGYAGYSVSQSKLETTYRYIERQREHHKRLSFRDEYILFLKEYGVDYDDNYLWT